MEEGDGDEDEPAPELSAIAEGSKDALGLSPSQGGDGEGGEGGNGDREGGDGDNDGDDNEWEMSAEEEAIAVRRGMEEIVGTGDHPPSAFAVTMLCVRAGWDYAGWDLIKGLFAAFADRLYAVLTLPHDSVQPGALEGFQR